MEVGRIKVQGLSADRVGTGEDDGTCSLVVGFRPCEVGCRGCDTWREVVLSLRTEDRPVGTKSQYA